MTPLKSAMSNSDRLLKAPMSKKGTALHHLLGQIEAICEFNEVELTKEKLNNMVKSALDYAGIEPN